jgi:hypothetical protein
MGVRLAFDRLVHSDWSVSPQKRWTATAVHSSQGWLVVCLEQTPPSDNFVDYLFNCSGHTLAGFDFPIGLPSFYTMKTGLSLRDLILNPSSDRAKRFLTPVETLFDISPDQPFYRKHPKGGRHGDLLRGIECGSICDLLRECDKRTSNRLRAESIFWTVGAKQVGKAALAGWREMLVSALARGAGLWPFDGPLSSLARNKLTIAEPYPAEAYQHIGMAKTIKKRSQAGRKAAGATMIEWAAKRDVSFAEYIKMKILSGFGEGEDGEDPFDAVAGLCGMIEVADGRRAEGPCTDKSMKPGEGWILGQIDLPI